MIMEKLGGRKFVFAVLLTLLFGLFVALGKMDTNQFMTASLVAYGLFAGANVIQKLK